MTKEHIYHSNYKVHIRCDSTATAIALFQKLKAQGKDPKRYTTPVPVRSAI